MHMCGRRGAAARVFGYQDGVGVNIDNGELNTPGPLPGAPVGHDADSPVRC